jgi:hypothetical protein
LPASAGATEAPEVPWAPVIITEIQTGAATAADEFVEIYNRSNADIDITGWQIRYANPTGEPSLISTAGGQNGAVILSSHTYFTFFTPSLGGANLTGQEYPSALTKTDKIVALYAADHTHCQYVAQDAVAWKTTGISSVYRSEGEPVSIPTAQTSKEKLLQRFQDTTGAYVDENDNSHDFSFAPAVAGPIPGIAAGATPGVASQRLLPADTIAVSTRASLTPFAIVGCAVSAPTGTEAGSEIPTSNEVEEPAPLPGSQNESDTTSNTPTGTGPLQSEAPGTEGPALSSPLITEVLPNPSPPQTDEDDEFIELYNPNEQTFDISGYSLEVGITTKYHYVFAQGTRLPAAGYMTFYADITGLSIANGGGQVRLLNMQGGVVGQSEVYTAAKEGQAWALINGAWQWTDSPTPNALNVASTAPISKVAAAQKPGSAVKMAKVASAKAATKSKAVTPKSSKSKSAAEKKITADTVQHVAALEPSKGSLHLGVVATIGIFAILYGAYEYRSDLANKFHQLRANRRHRGEAGQKSAGR